MCFGHRAAAAALLFFTAVVLPEGAGGRGTDAAALLGRVAEKYAGVKTLSARFRQEVPLRNVGVVRKAAGTVYFERPLRMRWDYRTPGEQLFLADGRFSYFRPPDSKRVFRRKIDEGALGGRIPLLLLFGKGDLTEHFRALEAVPVERAGRTALRLVPREGGAPDVRRVDLVVDDADLAIREIHLYDRLGGANHLSFDDILLNPSLPAGLVRVREMPGIEVVDG